MIYIFEYTLSWLLCAKEKIRAHCQRNDYRLRLINVEIVLINLKALMSKELNLSLYKEIKSKCKISTGQ